MATKRKPTGGHGGPDQKKKRANQLEVPTNAVSRETRSKSKSVDQVEPEIPPTSAPIEKVGKPEVKKTKKSWSQEERAYLEIMYQKLNDAVASKKQPSLPHARKVFNAFNTFFNQDREWGSFTSQVQRPHSTVSESRKAVMGKMKDNSDNAWIPEITGDEIRAYLKHGPAVAKSGLTQATKKSTESGPAPLEKTGKPGQKVMTGSPETDLGDANLSKTQTQQQTDKPPSDSTANVTSGPKETLGVLKHQQSTRPQLSSQLPKDHSSESKSLLVAASWRSPTHAFKGEPPVKVTPAEEVEKLIADGYKFTDMPEDDREAIKRHLEKVNGDQIDDTWLIVARDNLDGRIRRRGKHHISTWHRDSKTRFDNNKIASEAEEDWHKLSARMDGAAGVNGMRGAAIIPPLGYTGPVEDLVNKDQLPARELMLEQRSQEAIKKVNDPHKPVKNKPQFDPLGEDSDVTGDESS